MLDQRAVSSAEETLRSADFYNPKHREIFEVLLLLSGKKTPLEVLFIADELKKRNQLENIGGIQYLMDLSENVGFTSNIDSYCKIVEDKAVLRSLIRAGDMIMSKSYESSEDVEEIVSQSERAVFEISQKKHSEGLTPISESLLATMDIIETMSIKGGQITGVSTGLLDLDARLSGLQKSDLVLIAARPSMGKTALGMNIALNAAVKGNTIAVFSLEMSKTQIVQRMMSSISRINLKDIISGDINDWGDLGKAIGVLENLNLFIDDTASISLTEMRAKTRRLKSDRGLDLIVIDYLQLMTTGERVENRQQEISSISRGLKAMAKELECPVVALAQLSRAPELRADHRPIMSDLRESGAIEQDADVIMLLYREDYYEEDSPRKNIADLIIAKHRNGPTGTVELAYQKELTKFVDLVREY